MPSQKSEHRFRGVLDQRHGRLAEDAASDIRYAVRSLRRTPIFTITSVLTLAVGIGVNTAIFSAVDGVLFKPLPFGDAERIVAVFQRDARKPTARDDVAPGTFLDVRQRAKSFAQLAAAEPYSLILETPAGPENVRNWNVTEGFFDALGVRAYLGRTFEAPDFAPGSERVIVISYEAWQRRYGSERSVIGRRIRLERAPATIVGVLPPNVTFPTGREMWSPKIFTEDERQVRGSAFYRVIGRLAPGVDAKEAAGELQIIAAQLAREYPRTNADVGLAIIPLSDHLVGHVRPALLLLLGAVGLVLLIACANVASLLLARATQRRRELAIRAALGAGRGRVVRQLLAESLVLASFSAAASLVLAYWCVGAIRSLSPANLPRVSEMQVDGRALLFALAATGLTTLLCGLAPSLRAASADVHTGLRAGGRTVVDSAQRQHLRRWLVASEVALAVLLLVGAGLLVRSFATLLRVERGYSAEHVLTASIFVWQWNETPEARATFVREAVARLAALPGVQAAGATSSLPIPDRIGPVQGQIAIEGRPPAARGEDAGAHVSIVTPDVFTVLRIPLRAGRLFTSADDGRRAPVALVNEAMARRHWPGESPIGKYVSLRFGRFDAVPERREIIGIVGDVRQSGLESTPQPAVFLPHAQSPTGSITLVLRTANDPAATLPALRSTLAEMNSELPLASGATLEALLDDTMKPRRFSLLLLGSFSLAALVLAIAGVYGLIAQSAAERTQEIGVRMALGARGADVLGLVMRDGLAPAVAGTVAGLLAAAALVRLVRGMLFGIAPFDAITFGSAAGLMLFTAVAACLLPAWRAARLDPVLALRGE